MENFRISENKRDLDVNRIHQYLSEESYWAKGRNKEDVLLSIENSYCAGLFVKDQQVGFARAITDFVTHAYLCDVFVEQPYRNQGVGFFFLDSILRNPRFEKVRWSLRTTRSRSLYMKLGFVDFDSAEGWMRRNPIE